MAASQARKLKRKKVEDEGGTQAQPEPMTIDRAKNWVFNSEEEVFQHFDHEIKVLELELENLKTPEDIRDEEVPDFEEKLGELFEQPDEVWRDSERFDNVPIFTYLKKFGDLWYIALTYVDENVPTFIFIHFPTRDEKMVEAYRRTEKVYGKEQSLGEGDALSDGDPLAIGLYKAMMTVRGEQDIPESAFAEFTDFRDATVEEADEIWRSQDHQGNTLVTFIKDFHTEDDEFTYITITREDNLSESHFVLFSFPTKDKTLVDRYRHGETLHTEDVVQEESH